MLQNRNLISDQYGCLCVHNAIKAPHHNIEPEDRQLAAIIDHFKETTQMLEIYKNLMSGELISPTYDRYIIGKKNKLK